jgi:hypothetical protein
MAHYDYESDSVYAIPSIKDTVKHLKDCYFEWHRDSKQYYKFTNNNDKDIIQKFGRDNFTKQIRRII